MRNKKVLLSILFIGIFLVIFGVSYAFFEYSKVGANHELIAGDIYMNFNEGTDSLSLGSVYPESVEHARSRDDNYITFTIDGKNESEKDIYYEIDLMHGDDHDGLTRFNDKDLKFDLSEIVDGEETLLKSAVSFNEINNTRLWVDKVGSKEGLYDFKLINPDNYDVNISNCVSFFNDFYGDDVSLEQDGYQSFCSGEGKAYDGWFVMDYMYISLNDLIFLILNCPVEDEMYSINNLIENDVISNLQTGNKYYMLKSDYDVSSCTLLLNTVSSPADFSDDYDGYVNFCEGTGTTMGYPIDEFIKQDIVEDDFWGEFPVNFIISTLTVIDTDNELFIPLSSGEVNKIYKLRMWLDENVLISDTNPNASYSASTYKNHYASIKVRVVGDFDERTMPQPVYYAFADIADINYSYFETDTDIMTIPGITNNYTTIEHITFIKFEGPEKSVCAIINGNLECFKNNNYENEKVHLQSIFDEEDCHDSGFGFSCYDGSSSYFDVLSNGTATCYDYWIHDDCSLYGDGSFGCYVMAS